MIPRIYRLIPVAALALIASGCAPVPAPSPTAPPPAPAVTAPSTAAAGPPPEAPVPRLSPPVKQDIAERLKQLPLTRIDYDRSLLNDEEKRVVAKLIEASRFVDEIFLRQVSEENLVTRRALAYLAPRSPAHRDALLYFDLMKGPWDRLKDDEAFVEPLGPDDRKPPGAGFYPVDMKKEELEAWVKTHPEDKDAFEGLYTVIRRQFGELAAIPYYAIYDHALINAAVKLREAAALTSDASLASFLRKRAEAFLSNDYYDSDVAWMDLKGPIDIAIGPYEVYEDALFNYKAAFEAFVMVVDRAETEKLAVYTSHLPDMERHLPIPEEHKNLNRGTDSPIRVVQEIFTAGDGRRGVQTSAFNLPNDEKVREAKGSKNILLKNVMDAKFAKSGAPIARRVLDPSLAPLVSFAAYFNHTLFHELSHGLGPGFIKGPDGQRVEWRRLLKELNSTIEECKADVVGLWNLLYAIDQKWMTGLTPEAVLATNAGLHFRSLRFGLTEAHGQGTAVQWNWYREKGGILPAGSNRFRLDFTALREAVRSLANELLMIEATGDYGRAKKLLDSYGTANPEMTGVISTLKDVPVDIAPVFTAAGEE